MPNSVVPISAFNDYRGPGMSGPSADGWVEIDFGPPRNQLYCAHEAVRRPWVFGTRTSWELAKMCHNDFIAEMRLRIEHAYQ